MKRKSEKEREAHTHAQTHSRPYVLLNSIGAKVGASKNKAFRFEEKEIETKYTHTNHDDHHRIFSALIYTIPIAKKKCYHCCVMK